MGVGTVLITVVSSKINAVASFVCVLHCNTQADLTSTTSSLNGSNTKLALVRLDDAIVEFLK